MRITTIGLLLLTFPTTAIPLQAQVHTANARWQGKPPPAIAKSVERLAAGLQPTTQRGGGEAMWWTGWAMVAGGGVLAALSNNVLSRRDVSAAAFYPTDCDDPAANLDCTKVNQGTLWAGLGVAGVGAVMAVIGKGRRRPSVDVVPMAGGGAVFKRISF